MRKTVKLSILVLFLLTALNCEKEDIYERPSWLAGKLYTQILERPELSTFAQCIELTGYDSIIDVSGSYTVFAPNNEAFAAYLQAHPEYGSVNSIPREVLSRIVKFHIVQNPWSAEQLRQLDVYGWIDSLDLANDEPRGFKRETLLREKDRNYGVAKSPDYVRPGDDKKYIIVDTTLSTWFRKNSIDSRKYAPVFYQEYFDIYNLTANDYFFYFGRLFDPSKMYFVNGQIVEADIFAENGFIHVIDQVVEPLQNAYQLLSSTEDEYDYSNFLNLINTFPEFSYSREKTLDQPGADLGYQVDSLFDISYPELAFGIINERTSAPRGVTGLPANVTIRYQHGLIAPTNEALQTFENEYMIGPNRWGSLLQAPEHIRRMMVNTHMAPAALYPSHFTRGFYNGENDLITLNEATIVQKQYGSNCSFIGVNEVVVPRAFTSVTGPVYLERSYSRVMYTIERSGLLTALKRVDNDYMFFVENDVSLALDSSLFYNTITEQFAIYQVIGMQVRSMPVTTTDLRNLILNHIATRQATGIPRKEFLKNLAGNYIIVNNLTGEYRGSAPTTFGYNGSEVVTVVPELISANADNGTTWDISNWFNFSSGTVYGIISTSFPEFHSLLVSAGLADSKNYRYTFMSPDEYYTVFAPSAAAIAAYSTAGFTTEQLQKFLMMHFVQGSLIFTDGFAQPGYYETARVDEKSTQYTKIFTKVYINPLTDAIEFRYGNGTSYLSVDESDVTNVMTARVIDPEGTTLTHPTIVTNGVIHEIDKVFVFGDMDTQ